MHARGERGGGDSCVHFSWHSHPDRYTRIPIVLADRVTYKTGGTVWRVSVYCHGKNSYVGTFNSEILGTS